MCWLMCVCARFWFFFFFFNWLHFLFSTYFFFSGYIFGSRNFLRSETSIALYLHKILSSVFFFFFFFPFQVLISVLKKLAVHAVDLKTAWGDYKKKCLCKCANVFFFFFFFWCLLQSPAVFFSPCTCLTFDILFHLFPFLDKKKKKFACQESCFAISNTMWSQQWLEMLTSYFFFNEKFA